MVGYKKIISALLLTTLAGITVAQNNTNSPYTRYGYGQLSDQSFGNSKAMGGLAYGLRDGSQINASNPASYTAIDSLTFLFEGGLTLQNMNISDGITKINTKNSSFDYIAMQFRASKHLAMSAGFLPFSNVGYNFGADSKITDPNNPNNYTNTRYSSYGDGGLHQVYAGAGYTPFKGLSVGANVSYLFGSIDRTLSVTFPNNGSITPYGEIDNLRVRDYKLDLGLQYTQYLGKKNALTLGVVFSPGHNLNSEASRIRSTSVSDTTQLNNHFDLPQSFGVGFTYVYNNSLTVGFDYSLQKWGKTNYFGEKSLRDRSKYSIGAEYVPNRLNRNYFSRVKYRVGAYYSDPYIKVPSNVTVNNTAFWADGPKEYGVSAGFGLPVFKSKSILSISAQYVKVEARTKNMVNENYLKLSVGITFNERWFAKWKME